MDSKSDIAYTVIMPHLVDDHERWEKVAIVNSWQQVDDVIQRYANKEEGDAWSDDGVWGNVALVYDHKQRSVALRQANSFYFPLPDRSMVELLINGQGDMALFAEPGSLLRHARIEDERKPSNEAENTEFCSICGYDEGSVEKLDGRPLCQECYRAAIPSFRSAAEPTLMDAAKAEVHPGLKALTEPAKPLTDFDLMVPKSEPKSEAEQQVFMAPIAYTVVMARTVAAHERWERIGMVRESVHAWSDVEAIIESKAGKLEGDEWSEGDQGEWAKFAVVYDHKQRSAGILQADGHYFAMPGRYDIETLVHGAAGMALFEQPGDTVRYRNIEQVRKAMS